MFGDYEKNIRREKSVRANEKNEENKKQRKLEAMSKM